MYLYLYIYMFKHIYTYLTCLLRRQDQIMYVYVHVWFRLGLHLGYFHPLPNMSGAPWGRHWEAWVCGERRDRWQEWFFRARTTYNQYTRKREHRTFVYIYMCVCSVYLCITGMRTYEWSGHLLAIIFLLGAENNSQDENIIPTQVAPRNLIFTLGLKGLLSYDSIV